MNWQRPTVIVHIPLSAYLVIGFFAQSAPRQNALANVNEQSAPDSTPIEKTPPPLIQALQSADEAPYRETFHGFRRELAERPGAKGKAFHLRIHVLKSNNASADKLPGHEEAEWIFSLRRRI